jgi:hypothetical protein
VPVPPFTYENLLANMGEMTNHGFEIGIRGDIVPHQGLYIQTPALTSLPEQQAQLALRYL